MVVWPTVNYTANVWWSRVKFRTSTAGKAELSKLQRLPCLGITGAMRMTLWQLQLRSSMYSLHYIWSWRLRPEQEFTDFVAMEKGSSNLKSMGVTTYFLAWWKNPPYRPELTKYQDMFIVSLSWPGFLTEVNGKVGLKQQKWGISLVWRWFQDKWRQWGQGVWIMYEEEA
jgi:hypothetical protein